MLQLTVLIILGTSVFHASTFVVHDRDPFSLRSEREANASDREEVGCPACTKDSVCCKKYEQFQCCSKVYTIGGETIEIDLERNIASDTHSDGPTYIVDFNKEQVVGRWSFMIGVGFVLTGGLWFSHDPATDRCAVGTGVDFDIDDLIAASVNETNEPSSSNKAFVPHYSAEIPDSEPLRDTSMIPEALQDKCGDKPVFWHERVLANELQSDDSDARIEKRRSRTICICWMRCWFRRWRRCTLSVSIG